jgi:SLT domain-containing protein
MRHKTPKAEAACCQRHAALQVIRTTDTTTNTTASVKGGKSVSRGYTAESYISRGGYTLANAAVFLLVAIQVMMLLMGFGLDWPAAVDWFAHALFKGF